jgi:hypothetical protein
LNEHRAGGTLPAPLVIILKPTPIRIAYERISLDFSSISTRLSWSAHFWNMVAFLLALVISASYYATGNCLVSVAFRKGFRLHLLSEISISHS